MNIVVVIGAGGIGRAIAHRQGSGRTVLLADRNPEVLAAAAEALRAAAHPVTTHPVDVAARESVRGLARHAAELGEVVDVVHTAGLSPVQASPEAILAVDLVGVAIVLDEFGAVVAEGGAGLVVSSMAGHMRALAPLTADQEHALAYTPTDELPGLPFLSAVGDPGAAYALAKRANHLRVQAAAVSWGRRGARVNAISPGIILTPLAQEEMSGPGAAGYQAMIKHSAAGRVGTTDEVAAAAAYLLTAGFVTGSDLLIDGGVIAAMNAGELALGS
ncbi:SDR family oxidoreductase [Actinoplanes sp. NPDC048791]|uniref:SDR family oxidoreductase n=1 Tax=Actinoplanes sp. NPDC048791 TaxID=3154623 RepID=UPI0033FBCEB8